MRPGRSVLAEADGTAEQIADSGRPRSAFARRAGVASTTSWWLLVAAVILASYDRPGLEGDQEVAVPHFHRSERAWGIGTPSYPDWVKEHLRAEELIGQHAPASTASSTAT